MVISYILKMAKTQDLRLILSQNIRKARTSLHISQAKLAEFANISVSHMLDIEYCKTWVSDKTLQNIAQALDIESYELLIPDNSKKTVKLKPKKSKNEQTAAIISRKKREMNKKLGEIMDNLIFELNKSNQN